MVSSYANNRQVMFRFLPGGGDVKILTGDARPIFWDLKFGQTLLFWVGNFFTYFSGFRKISNSGHFGGLTNSKLLCWVKQYLYHTLESFE